VGGVQDRTISLIGCDASGAYALGPDEEEEESSSTNLPKLLSLLLIIVVPFKIVLF